jgi:hypothetical protein
MALDNAYLLGLGLAFLELKLGREEHFLVGLGTYRTAYER